MRADTDRKQPALDKLIVPDTECPIESETSPDLMEGLLKRTRPLTPGQILSLQRKVGNQATQRLINSSQFLAPSAPLPIARAPQNTIFRQLDEKYISLPQTLSNIAVDQSIQKLIEPITLGIKRYFELAEVRRRGDQGWQVLSDLRNALNGLFNHPPEGVDKNQVDKINDVLSPFRDAVEHEYKHTARGYYKNEYRNDALTEKRLQAISDRIFELMHLWNRFESSEKSKQLLMSVEEPLRKACSLWLKRIEPVLDQKPDLKVKFQRTSETAERFYILLQNASVMSGGKDAQKQLKPFAGKKGGEVGKIFQLDDQHIWKPESKSWGKKDRLADGAKVIAIAPAASNTNIPLAGARLSARAVAAKRIDDLLKTHALPETELLAIGGRIGQKQRIVKGRPLAELQQTRDSILKQDWYLLAKERLDLVNYLTLQADNNPGNTYVDAEQQTVQGIDMDFSFGQVAPEHEPVLTDMGHVVQVRKIDFNTAITLMKEISPGQIIDALKDLLSEDEIKATLQRFEKVKSKITTGQISIMLKRREIKWQIVEESLRL
jgi:hypothetical protein